MKNILALVVICLSAEIAIASKEEKFHPPELKVPLEKDTVCSLIPNISANISNLRCEDINEIFLVANENNVGRHYENDFVKRTVRTFENYVDRDFLQITV